MAITLDSISNSDSGGSNVSTLTYAHVVSGSNTIIIVFLSVAAIGDVSGVTYAGAALTQLGSEVTSGFGNGISVWYKTGPTAGTNNIIISLTTAKRITAASASYDGVAQSSTFGTVATNSGTSTTSSTNVTTTASTQLVLDFLEVGFNTASPTSSQVIESSDANASSGDAVNFADKTATGSTMTMTWSSLGSGGWGEIVVAMNASTGAAAAAKGSTLALMGVG